MSPAVFLILLSLARDRRHGYGIMLDVAWLTRGRVPLGPGTLYRSIRRMLGDGLIEETEAPRRAGRDPRRRPYRLTRRGRRVAEAEARRLAELVKAAAARGLLGPAGRAARPALRSAARA